MLALNATLTRSSLAVLVSTPQRQVLPVTSLMPLLSLQRLRLNPLPFLQATMPKSVSHTRRCLSLATNKEHKMDAILLFASQAILARMEFARLLLRVLLHLCRTRFPGSEQRDCLVLMEPGHLLGRLSAQFVCLVNSASTKLLCQQLCVKVLPIQLANLTSVVTVAAQLVLTVMSAAREKLFLHVPLFIMQIA